MNPSDLARPYKLWTAKVYVKQPRYVGYMDVTVSAQDQQTARTLMRGLYAISDHQITNLRQVK